jgi:hypothetical protein
MSATGGDVVRLIMLACVALLWMPWAMQADEAPADIDPNLQQYVPHLKQMLKNELQFAVRVCESSSEQALQLETACLAAFPRVLKRLSDQQQLMQRGRAPKEAVDARQLIVSSITDAVRETQPAAAGARYAAEIQRRAAARRRAAILNLAAHLDRLLVLSAEQRSRLVESLDAGWQDDWQRLPEALQFGVDYLPPVPEALLAPVLNAKQMEIWKALPKQGPIQFGLPGLGLLQWVEVQGQGVVIDVELRP